MRSVVSVSAGGRAYRDVALGGEHLSVVAQKRDGPQRRFVYLGRTTFTRPVLSSWEVQPFGMATTRPSDP